MQTFASYSTTRPSVFFHQNRLAHLYALPPEALTDADYLAIAQEHYERKRFWPDIFRNRRNGIASRALENHKSLAHLKTNFPTLSHYTYHAAALGLSGEHEEADGFFDPRIVQNWKDALRDQHPIHWGRVEVGNPRDFLHGRLHAHAIAPSGEKAPYGCEKPANLETHVAYLCKPPLPSSDRVLIGKYLHRREQARRTKTRLPATKWAVGIPRERQPHSHTRSLSN